MVKVEQCKKKFYNLGVKPFMNMIVSSRKEQQTLVMELNMTLLNSIFLFYCRAPVSPPPNKYDSFSEFSPS